MDTPYFKRTTPAFRLPLLVAVALISTMALGGCTTAEPAHSPTAGEGKVTHLVPEPAVPQKAIACPLSLDAFPSNADTTYPAKPRGSVPEGFVVEKVVLCRPDKAEVAGTTKMVVKQQALQGDFAPLLAALAIPSDRADGEKVVCNAILETIPVLWLVTASGQAIDVAWPTTECRQASGKPDTQKAIDALSVSSSKIVPGSGQ